MSDVLRETLTNKWQDCLDITNVWLSKPDTWFVNYERQNIFIQVEILVNLKVALGVNKNLRFLEKMCSL